MSETWKYASNQFETVTNRNYKLGYDLFNDHKARLLASPEADIHQWGLDFTPLCGAYETAYNVWKNTQGQRSGSSTTLADMLRDLSGTKIAAWDVSIQGVYPKKTPAYVALMPNGRKPFQTGTYDSRLAAVQALKLALTDTTVPDGTKDAVTDFAIDLAAALQQQSGNQQGIEAGSEQVELERMKCCLFMYKILGLLMAKYHPNPVQIESLYNLALLRTKPQTTYTRTLAIAGRFSISKTIDPVAPITITNTGQTILLAFRGTTKLSPPPASPSQVLLGDTLTTTLNDLPGTGNILIVQNSSDALKGKTTVTIG